jgi:protein involved in temperature-dependent protein secretion
VTQWDGSDDERGWTGLGQRVWATDARPSCGMLDVRELLLQA